MAGTQSFHCIICFDPFDSNERFPVVLPCGHTYVCIVCASRLENCMECRMSLSYPLSNDHPPPPSSVSSHNNTRIQRQSQRRQTPQRQKPIKREKKRHPLPKNLVLLSIMDETRNAGKAEKEATRRVFSGGLPLATSACSSDDAEEVMSVRTGACFASSACGTYAVAVREGLEVVSILPVQDSHESVRVILQDLESGCYDFPDMTVKNPITLWRVNFGDKLQIVSMRDGWAQLARRKGYIRFDPSQLVKVKGPLDRACRVEGILHSLHDYEVTLKKEHDKIDRLKIELAKDLEGAFMSDDLTVIKAPLTPIEMTEEIIDKRDSPQPEPEPRRKQERNTYQHQKQPSKVRSPNPNTGIDFRTGMSGHRALLSFNAKSSHVQEKNCNHSAMSNHSGLSRPAKSWHLTKSSSHDHDGSPVTEERNDSRTLLSHSFPPSPSLHTGPLVRNGTSLKKHIDFKTGLSGHMAVQSHSVYSHERIPVGKIDMNRMSGHSGLNTPLRSKKKGFFSLLATKTK